MTFEAYVHGFGCIPNPPSYEEARAVVLPVPLERTLDPPGVAMGPLALLGASRFLETYDCELGVDPIEDRVVATQDALQLDYSDAQAPLTQIEQGARKILRDGKLALALGGSRALALPMVCAAQSISPEAGVVAFWGQPGFLSEDRGLSLTHKTVGKRLAERATTCFFGLRTMSAAEATDLATSSAPRLCARQVISGQCAQVSLPTQVHLSVDVGALDPACLPIPGNVEPGGLPFYSLLDALDHVFATTKVLSVDVCGFVPSLGDVAPSMTVAQLVLRCLAQGTRR